MLFSVMIAAAVGRTIDKGPDPGKPGGPVIRIDVERQ